MPVLIEVKLYRVQTRGFYTKPGSVRVVPLMTVG